MKAPVFFVVLSAILALQQRVEAAAPATVQSSAKAINYQYLTWSTTIDFKGTALLADAMGTAKVKSKAGATRIRARFENLPAANRFGPEYLTYVLWAISPEGR